MHWERDKAMGIERNLKIINKTAEKEETHENFKLQRQIEIKIKKHPSNRREKNGWLKKSRDCNF